MITQETVRITFCAALALLVCAGSASALDVYLRAEVVTVSLPCGVPVTCWGFARDTAAGALDGLPTVPGPYIVVPPGDPVLRVSLTNNLTVPVSFILNGQSLPTNDGAATAPVRHGVGPYQDRVRSFVHETAPGATGVYLWSSLRPGGTYLYSSGTHPGLQVQMGLFGAMAHDAATGQVYAGESYAAEVLLVFHEIDTALHDAVATGQYGPGLAVTSPMVYRANWFLVNGQPNRGKIEGLAGGAVGEATLLRLVNAGLDPHAPTVNGLRMRVLGEGGFRYPFAKDQASLNLAPQATADAVVTPTQVRLHAVYDRTLSLSNAGAPSGGMLRHLAFGDVWRAGDVDASGLVEWNDFMAWQTDFGKAGCLGLTTDLNNDGVVDWTDYFLLAVDFGKTSPPM